ncbi:hypothetical protein [Mahella australiensis]|uniref:hypothetical protein n=1 Tax=Mahella australiensis TaxID=252966 RepID=UPI0002E51F2E|nr:hypothetical protein [Mahella australiensis]
MSKEQLEELWQEVKKGTIDGQKLVRLLVYNGICPECGDRLAHEGGCVTCYSCGWSACN